MPGPLRAQLNASKDLPRFSGSLRIRRNEHLNSCKSSHDVSLASQLKLAQSLGRETVRSPQLFGAWGPPGCADTSGKSMRLNRSHEVWHMLCPLRYGHALNTSLSEEVGMKSRCNQRPGHDITRKARDVFRPAEFAGPLVNMMNKAYPGCLPCRITGHRSVSAGQLRQITNQLDQNMVKLGKSEAWPLQQDATSARSGFE